MRISSSDNPRIERGVARALFRALAALALFAALGCGGASAAEGATEPSGPRAVELTLRTADGRFIDVGDLRGHPVLLVFLTTYDTVSQAALVPLRRIVLTHPDTAVVGVLAQAEAESLLDAFVFATNPPFSMGYDAGSGLLEGQTAIGAIEGVPLFIALDRAGRIAARRVGFASEAQLDAMLRRADEAVPRAAVTPPPLMGNAR